MTAPVHTTAYAWACAAGHAGRHGEPLRMVVPGGLDLAPACTACGQPMTRAARPLEGTWRVDECCTPAGPGGRWAGPPRDPRACTSCFGTRQRTLCLACYAVNCDGDHGGECLACDGDGAESCPACEGEGRIFDQSGEDSGPCTAPRCAGGRVPCQVCGGTRRANRRDDTMPRLTAVLLTGPGPGLGESRCRAPPRRRDRRPARTAARSRAPPAARHGPLLPAVRAIGAGGWKG